MRLALPPLRRNRIALTSLVDVVFILLFFFMLASQSLDWRALRVDLAPVAFTATETSSPTETLVVLLLADGRLRQDGRTLELSDLRADIQSQQPLPEVILVPGPGATLQQLVDLIDALTPTGADVRLGRAEVLP